MDTTPTVLHDESLRLDAIGSVARAWATSDVESFYVQIARGVRAGRLPRLIMTGAVLSTISHGLVHRRSLAAMGNTDEIASLLVAILTTSVYDQGALDLLRACVHSVKPLTLDAVEDILAESTEIRTMIELERMRRSGLLAEDWLFVPVSRAAAVPRKPLGFSIQIREGEPA